jgi:hypothetical protein
VFWLGFLCVCAKIQFVCGNFINVRTVYEGVLKVPHMFMVVLELICICEDSFAYYGNIQC